MKTAVYESLYAINQATQNITEHIEKLKADGLLTPHFAEIRALNAHLTCAEISVSAMATLTQRVQEEASKTEKHLIETEKRLKSS